MQGRRTPPHIAFRARATSEYTRATASVSALERSRLALNQARSALKMASRVRGAGNAASSTVDPRVVERRSMNWLVLLLIGAVAIETFILLRPFVVNWFDATFTQKFLATPTRLGFRWSDVIANALAALVLVPFGWLVRRARAWFANT